MTVDADRRTVGFCASAPTPEPSGAANRTPVRGLEPPQQCPLRRLVVALLVAIVAFLHFDPAAPATVWTTETDPDPFATREGRRVVEDVYVFEAVDPWRVHAPESRELYRERLAAMFAEWGASW